MAAIEGRPVSVPQSNLHQQDLSKLDVTKLTAVSPEVISRQATINIGTIGHVAHGKSTVVKAISGVQTVRFKNELERNITIKLERLPAAVIRAHCRGGSAETPRRAVKRKRKFREKEEYTVESILAQEVRGGRQSFLIKWKNWPTEDSTWEPIEHLQNCSKALEVFVSSQIDRKHAEVENLKKEISFGNILDQAELEKLWATHRDYSRDRTECPLDLLALLSLHPDEEEFACELVLKARKSMQLAAMFELHQKQQDALAEWQKHINQVDLARKIKVENKVDLEGPPADFKYVNQNVPSEGVVIPADPPIGCECKACNIKSKCFCASEGGLFAYTYNKRLRVCVGTPIYECNKACRCPPDCHNRVVQNGRTVKLCIFRTSSGCGWGVRAEQRIREGQFVCQYVGEVITFEEAERRGKLYDAQGLTYLFDLDFNSEDNPYTVDAFFMGNISHFINHSCDPNLAVLAVWGDCLDPNLPLLALFATRDIAIGEEVCFDYMQKSSTNEQADTTCKEVGSHTRVSQTILHRTPEKQQGPLNAVISPRKPRLDISDKKDRFQCRCGSTKCRKYFFK